MMLLLLKWYEVPMRRLLVLLVVIACASPPPIEGPAGGGRSSGGSGTAGGSTAGGGMSTAGGGTAGGFGTAGGRSGTAGGGAVATAGGVAYPGCAYFDVLDTCVLEPDGGLAQSLFKFDGGVAFTDVSVVDGGLCRGAPGRPSMRFTLPNGYVLITSQPQYPAGLISAGEVVEVDVSIAYAMTSFDRPDYAFSISRDGGMLLFAAYRDGFAWAPPVFPGVAFVPGGGACGTGCGVGYDVQVTAGGQSRVVTRGGTAQVGDWTVTLEEFRTGSSSGGCDAPGVMHVAGVRTP